MFKIAAWLFFLITIVTKSSNGSNVFTDPIKLRRLFEFQIRLSRNLPTISTKELSILPKDVLINLYR